MENEIRDKVREHYGEIASKVSRKVKSSGCCSGSACCSGTEKSTPGYTEKDVRGLPEEAVEASLGCANPLLFAELKEGETVLDLGSGGGIDVLAASRHVGKTGRVYGLDMTDEMLSLANANKLKMGVTNVDFLKGYIEDIPLKDNSIDVIVSNCVINLSEDKEKALSEAYRVLKNKGRLAIADMVSVKKVSPGIRKQVELWCGCLAGTLDIAEYRRILEKVGFRDIEIEPVSIFTRQIIEDLYSDQIKSIKDSDLDDADGTFASAHIKAVK